MGTLILFGILYLAVIVIGCVTANSWKERILFFLFVTTIVFFVCRSIVTEIEQHRIRTSDTAPRSTSR